MASNFTVSYIYQLRDKYSQPLKKIAEATKNADEAIRKFKNTVNQSSRALSKLKDRTSRTGLADLAQKARSANRQFDNLDSGIKEYAHTLQTVATKSQRLTTANDKLSRSVTNASKQTKIGKQRLSGFASRASGAQSVLATLASVMGGNVIIGSASRFQEAMNQLEAVTLATSSEMDKFSTVAAKLGATTQFTASQAGEGMTFLAMAGLNTKEVLEAIPGTLQLAAAGNIDLATASDIATNVLAQMGLEVSQLGRVNDVLAKIQSKANTNILQAAEAMKNVGTAANGVGIDIEQLTAMIGSLANAGVKGGEAGTLLRNAILRTVNPSTKALGTLSKLRVNLADFVTPEGKIKDFTGLIQTLEKRGATTAQIFTIFEERGGRAVQALMGQGKSAIDALAKSLENAGSTAEKMAKIQMKGLPGAIKTLKSATEGLIITIFKSGFGELLEGVINKVTGLVRSLATANPTLLKLAGIFGAVVIAGGPLLLMIGLMLPAITALLSPIGLIAIAIAGLITIVGVASTENSRLMTSLKILADAFSPLIELVSTAWDALSSLFKLMTGGKSFVDSLAIAFEGLAKGVRIALSPIKGLLKVKDALEGGKGVKGAFTAFKDTIKGALFDDTGEVRKEKLIQQEGIGFQRAAELSAQTTSTINGRIDVSASGGAEVQNAELELDMPGNLGFNMR